MTAFHTVTGCQGGVECRSENTGCRVSQPPSVTDLGHIFDKSSAVSVVMKLTSMDRATQRGREGAVWNVPSQ